jgi:hypothetical protein
MVAPLLSLTSLPCSNIQYQQLRKLLSLLWRKHTGAFSKEAGGGSNQKVIVNMNFNYEQNEIIENKD